MNLPAQSPKFVIAQTLLSLKGHLTAERSVARAAMDAVGRFSVGENTMSAIAECAASDLNSSRSRHTFDGRTALAQACRSEP